MRRWCWVKNNEYLDCLSVVCSRGKKYSKGAFAGKLETINN